MEVSTEVKAWLKKNAYLVKGNDYYFFPSFPGDKMPDRIEIPIEKILWEALRGETQ